MAKLAWDLKSGRAQLVDDATARGRDIVLARVRDPFGDPWTTALDSPPTIDSGTATVDVFGLDRRFCLVLSAYFRRAQWWAKNLASYDPGHLWDGTEGEGWTVGIKAYAIRRDDLGQVHQLAPINASLFLNGGQLGAGASSPSPGDGCEVIDGGDGVRFVFTFQADPPAPSDAITEMPAWDLCCALELKPNVVVGCDGLADAIVSHVEAFVPRVPVALNPLYGAA